MGFIKRGFYGGKVSKILEKKFTSGLKTSLVIKVLTSNLEILSKRQKRSELLISENNFFKATERRKWSFYSNFTKIKRDYVTRKSGDNHW